jgi:hypothetical protein
MSVWAAGSRVEAVDLGKRTEVVMRTWRTILAPAILTVGTIGSLVAGPGFSLTITAAPAPSAVAVCVSPHGVVIHE